MNADVNHDSARFQHIRFQQARYAGRRHHDIRLSGHRGQIRRTAVANCDGRISSQQQHRHRLADDIAAADNHGVLAGQFDAVMVQDRHRRPRRTRCPRTLAQ